MRVLDIRPQFEACDIRAGREALATETRTPNRVTLLIRGDTPEIAQFAARASKFTENVSWRTAIWIRDSRVLDHARERIWFGDDAEACAVILNFQNSPVGLLYPDSSLYEIEVMLLEAMRRLRREN